MSLRWMVWSFGLLCLFAMPDLRATETKSVSLGSGQVTFKIKNAGITVNGRFAAPTGTLNFDPASLETTTMDIRLSSSSINTGIEARDRHLRKQDYFDVERYPEIRMVSKSVRREGDSFIGTFELTLKATRKTLVIPFKASPKAGDYQLDATFRIDRRDYKVGGNSLILGDEVTVNVQLVTRNS